MRNILLVTSVHLPGNSARRKQGDKMNILTNTEMEQISGGDGALTEFGAQLASDGFRHADSSNPVVATFGVFVAAAGGWTWAIGSFSDGISSLFK
jgi:bacteriocin-like protein